MPKPTLFTAEFVLQLQRGYLQHPFPQGEIQEAISTGNIGQLSRLFDRMPMSAEAMEEAYRCMSESADTHQIEAHMRDVAISIASFLFNADLTHCNEHTITQIGKENHDALLEKITLMGAPTQCLIDKILQAIIVAYAQAITHHFEITKTSETTPTDEQMESTRAFNRKFTLPMEFYLAHMTKETLFSSFEEAAPENIDAVKTSLMHFSTLIGECREQLELLKHITTDSDLLEAIIISQKILRTQRDKLAECHEKLLATPGDPCIKNALQVLNELPLSWQQIIQHEKFALYSQAPLTRGLVELCIDTAARLLTLGNLQYKTEETRIAEILQNTREKIQSMKALLNDIKTSHAVDPAVSALT